MARLKVMFAKIVDMLLHWLRVDTHGNYAYIPEFYEIYVRVDRKQVP